MSTTRAALLLARLLGPDGPADREAVAWAINGLRLWKRADGTLPLEQCLRLPSTPRQARLRERNAWLTDAAQRIGGSSPYERASRLLRAAAAFRRRWPVLCHLAEPPAEFDAVSIALFFAMRSGADLPGTVEGIARIIGKTEAFIEEPFGVVVADSEKSLRKEADHAIG